MSGCSCVQFLSHRADIRGSDNRIGQFASQRYADTPTADTYVKYFQLSPGPGIIQHFVNQYLRFGTRDKNIFVDEEKSSAELGFC